MLVRQGATSTELPTLASGTCWTSLSSSVGHGAASLHWHWGSAGPACRRCEEYFWLTMSGSRDVLDAHELVRIFLMTRIYVFQSMFRIYKKMLVQSKNLLDDTLYYTVYFFAKDITLLLPLWHSFLDDNVNSMRVNTKTWFACQHIVSKDEFCRNMSHLISSLFIVY